MVGNKSINIGIIGYGNMGSAIAERIKAKYRVTVFDKDISKTGALKGIEVEKDIKELVEKSDAVILAVKPQNFNAVLREIKDFVKDKLIISIAAGITTDYIENTLKIARVVKVMPNLPAKVGRGISGISKGDSARVEDLNFTQELFSKLGKLLIVEENMMPAVTAISGSGPGFLCDLIEGKSKEERREFLGSVFVPSLAATAVTLGFTAEQAEILAKTTTRGTIKFIEVGHLSPAEMKKQVTSKKGTTEAGLKVLNHNIKNLTKAAKAALHRAKELSKI